MLQYTLKAALQKARATMRGTDVEHAVVDMSNLNLGLGEYIDQTLARDAGFQTLTLKIDAATLAQHMDGVAKIFVEGLGERERQDGQWGGPDHDDTYGPLDWLTFIECQTRRAARATGARMAGLPPPPESFDAADYRDRLVKILALSIVAIQSHDRVNTPSDLDINPESPDA